MRHFLRCFQPVVMAGLAWGLLALGAAESQAQVTVVNMVPVWLSAESNQDTEPNLAVSFVRRNVIAATAFTPDPLGGPNAPIYVSSNHGRTWTLRSILPGSAPGTCPGTCDVTLRFSSASIPPRRIPRLYIGMLNADSSFNINLFVLRSDDLLSAVTLENRGGPYPLIPDQPYVQASTTRTAGGIRRDRVYVGLNDLESGVLRPKTATVDRSLDATSPTPGFVSIRIDTANTRSCGQDGPSIRPAIHPRGTVYAAFFRWTNCVNWPFTSDVVVVRDDNWGASPSPFTALGPLGVRVATGVPIPWFDSLGGTQRIGSQLSTAVDPNDSQTVYVAWADGANAASYTIHVRRSGDGGATWTGDLRAVTAATNPALAINSHGAIGFLYQSLVGPVGAERWETHLERSSDGFATPPDDLVLADVPNDPTLVSGAGELGDYVHLLAVGPTFYGVFCAKNTPDRSNFPNGVLYQRKANFVTHTLLANDGVTPVPASIDPFFFRVEEPEEGGCREDCYDDLRACLTLVDAHGRRVYTDAQCVQAYHRCLRRCLSARPPGP